MRTTQAMRARIRELATRPDTDDYDRSVLMLLDDFAEMSVLSAITTHALLSLAQPYATPPGSVDQCAAHVSAEFQRRLNIAAEAMEKISPAGN